MRRNMASLPKMMGFVLLLLLPVIFLFLPESISASENMAEIIKRAVHGSADLAGWNFNEEPAEHRREASTYLEACTSVIVGLRKTKGSYPANMMIHFYRYDSPEYADRDYNRALENIRKKGDEILEENFGLGSRSIIARNYELIRSDGTPIGRQAPEVHAVWERYYLRLIVYNRRTEDVVTDSEAYKITKNLAKGIFALIRPSERAGPPRIHSVHAGFGHESRETANIRLITHIKYSEPVGSPAPGDITVRVSMDGRSLNLSPGSPGFIISGSEIRAECMIKTENAGKHRVTVDLYDRRYRLPSNPNINYEDHFRFDLEIEHPSAMIKGVSGIVAIKRKNPLTSAEGVLLLRDQPGQRSGLARDLERINSEWLYLGDEVYLQDTDQRYTPIQEGDISWPKYSGIELEWEGGVKGHAIFRRGIYTRSGRFTIGPTRGLSGEISNRWGRTYNDYSILFTQNVHDMMEGLTGDTFDTLHDIDNPVEWVLKSIPVAGGPLHVIHKYGIFSWFAGDTVYSDIQYLELNSEVYIKPEPGGELSFYVLEGNPVLYQSGAGSQKTLKPNTMASVSPNKPAVIGTFEPSELDRPWEEISYRPWNETAEESVRFNGEPVDLDLAQSIMDSLLGAPQFDIPSIRANVKTVRFYEAGGDTLPYGTRPYRNAFSKSETRVVWWEIGIENPDPATKMYFSIEIVYFNTDGTELNRHVCNTYIEPSWTSSFHTMGFGWLDKGNWSPGIYLVEFYSEGRKIARGSFEIKP